MELIINIFSLVGSLALFLYGMKTMSEGLEKFAGDRLRNILAAMTKNRIAGVLTGILITALIQSSSATTVMVVSFVNAGLMTLAQSIGVIMGANIGTTVTAWIISAVGFKVNIAAFAIPLLAVGMPFIFSRKGNRKSVGEFIFGFSFLFMGLSFLQEAATAMNIGDMVAGMLAHVPQDSFFTIILFVIVGTLVTMIVQASAATMAITLMLFGMNIPGFGFEQAAALAMGQNIGTTITAFMASLTANTQARRAALAHMFFNVFGVIWILFIFRPFVDMVCGLVGYDTAMVKSEVGHEAFIANAAKLSFVLAAFHTCFNVANTFILIWFIPQIERFVCWVIKSKNVDEEEDFRLHFITAGFMKTPELSVLEAQKEIQAFSNRMQRMFEMVRELLTLSSSTNKKDNKDGDFNKLFTRIEKYEGISDNMELEIAKYLDQVSDAHLSDETKAKIRAMLREISELESIGDANYNMARTISRKYNGKQDHFNEKQYSHINQMMELTEQSLTQMNRLMSGRKEAYDVNHTFNLENEINNYRNQLKAQNIVDINNHEYTYAVGTIYMDLINECEKLGDYVVNVVEARMGQRQKYI